MTFLQRLFGRKEEAAVATPEAAPSPECPHTTLVPRWDSVSDMGKDEAITSYHCDACSADFSREEGMRLLAAEEERVRQIGAPSSD